MSNASTAPAKPKPRQTKAEADKQREQLRKLLSGRGSLTLQPANGPGIAVSKADLRAALSTPGQPETVTTQQAAAILNVSRPYIIKLTDTGELPSIVTRGGHRRIPREPLILYKVERDRARREALNEMTRLGEEDGLYIKALMEARS